MGSFSCKIASSSRGGGSPGTPSRLRPLARSLLTCLAGCSIILTLASRQALADDDAPPWLRELSSTTLASYDKSAPAVVLLKEQSVRVSPDGRVTTVERAAVRILNGEGQKDALARASYLTDTGKVRDMRAWLIRPSGDVKRYGKESVRDVAAAPNDVFDETRLKLISARADAEPGAIFGYEWTLEDRSVFTQFEWQFQDRLPTLISRFAISLPEGWRAEGVTFNHSGIAPVISDNTYTWEKRDLPFLEDEPASPPVTNIAPRLAVSYFPPPGVKAGIAKSFDNWSSVSDWLAQLSESQAVADGALARRARQLAAGARTELEAIHAIARYVQGVNYVSIQTGIGRGGGYRPHPAQEVFAKSYGDCKDKANLMRAMLKAVNIPAYLVAIYAGDIHYVREEWPSPQQFNHMIIAVKVGDKTQAATVINHPALGRLLVFDPTDDNTPLGELPEYEQGSLALVIAGDAGGLVRMPVTPPEANRLERQAEVALRADGSITASLRERASGLSAVNERRYFRSRSRSEYMKLVEQWIMRAATGVDISRVEPVDAAAEGRFSLDVEFKAARYAEPMQGRLLVFKPALISRRSLPLLTQGAPNQPARRHPVVLEPHTYTESVRVKLPEGFDVDEMPAASRLDSSFGTYATTCEVKDGQLRFTRSLVLRAATLPAAEYPKVRNFFEQVQATEQAPVVLARR